LILLDFGIEKLLGKSYSGHIGVRGMANVTWADESAGKEKLKNIT